MRRFLTALAIVGLLSAPVRAASVNVGTYALAAQQITSALTAQALTAIANLSGMTAVTLEFNFQYGSGGTTAVGKVQTSFDGGTTWRDVAECDFTTTTRVCVANLSGLTAKASATFNALASEGVNDGLLGDQLRAVITTTGTYTNTTLTIRASVR